MLIEERILGIQRQTFNCHAREHRARKVTEDI